MTLTWGIIIAMVFIVLFVMLVTTLGEGLVKITAKESNIDPAKFSVLPGELSDIIGSSKAKPNFVPADEQVIDLKKGFDINLLGEAVIETEEIPTVRSATYALKPKDFIGMSPIPKVVVTEGDSVKAGDPLFYDKKRPEIIYAAPVSGEMLPIQRGEKRSINEVVILADKEVEYRKYENIPNLGTTNYEELTKFLLGSGAWPFIRQRPFNIVADYDVRPKSIFVTTFDTAPLAPSFNKTVEGKEAEFQKGLEVLAKLTEGKVHVALDGRGVEKPADAFLNVSGVERHWFNGQHPAGNVGVHIHHIDPVNSGEAVWHLDVHGVLVLGTLFVKGVFDTERVVALTGDELPNPTFIRTSQGACIDKFVADVEVITSVEVKDEEGNTIEANRKNVRLVAGDPLTGTEINANGYLGFFDDQLTTVSEGDYYELFGWLLPQKGHPTPNRTFPGGFSPKATYSADTNQNGEHRAFVVSGEYEAVLPMDIYPQYLLRAIVANDFERMEGLGILELAEEDLALCEYVCTSKQKVQQVLREGLDSLRAQV